jgi:hypothetical protein
LCLVVRAIIAIGKQANSSMKQAKNPILFAFFIFQIAKV